VSPQTSPSVNRLRRPRSPFRIAEDVSFLRPFVKWAGGKSQLLPQFRALFPEQKKIHRYVEPFLGSGAVFFNVQALLRPAHALLWDTNAELIDTFLAVRDEVDDLIEALRRHREQHSESHYYEVRAQTPQSRAERAARLIYLNKTGFNGLYRVNSRGLFNVPFGHRVNPTILNEAVLRAANVALKNTELLARDFRDLASVARKGDFIYFDPPYHPRSKTSSFTSYTIGSFGEKDQRDLADLYAKLDQRGCLLMLSNSDTPLIRELYADFRIRCVSARRMINSDGKKRGPISEVVVLNYHPAASQQPASKTEVADSARIYTRTGDRGQTQLAGGPRVAKSAQRLECLGDVDELSACIGLAFALQQSTSASGNSARMAAWLGRIQDQLSGLCADLAAPPGGKTRIAARHVTALERNIDAWTRKLPPLRAFIRPGGDPAAACLHLARTVCRRAERQVVRLASEEPVGGSIVSYLNRLSDALFVAARHATQLPGHEDTPT
jgi:DNA adenine methylase